MASSTTAKRPSSPAPAASPWSLSPSRTIESLEDLESLKQTASLMRSPTDAGGMLDAMERLDGGRGVAHDLAEPD